jgi:hypothetical protein
MKIARCTEGGAPVLGTWSTYRHVANPAAHCRRLCRLGPGAVTRRRRQRRARRAAAGPARPLATVRLLPPIEPSNRVVVAGANYAKHLADDFGLKSHAPADCLPEGLRCADRRQRSDSLSAAHPGTRPRGRARGGVGSEPCHLATTRWPACWATPSATTSVPVTCSAAARPASAWTSSPPRARTQTRVSARGSSPVTSSAGSPKLRLTAQGEWRPSPGRQHRRHDLGRGPTGGLRRRTFSFRW